MKNLQQPPGKPYVVSNVSSHLRNLLRIVYNLLFNSYMHYTWHTSSYKNSKLDISMAYKAKSSVQSPQIRATSHPLQCLAATQSIFLFHLYFQHTVQLKDSHFKNDWIQWIWYGIITCRFAIEVPLNFFSQKLGNLTGQQLNFGWYDYSSRLFPGLKSKCNS